MTFGPEGAQPHGLLPRVVETHSAVLFFVGDRVYKLKKPVDLGFLDFRTPEARRAACEAEVALNGRLAPDVYLGVADVREPSGDAWDSLVVMRRMPEDRRLSTLLTADPGRVHAALTDLARLMAEFHSRAQATSEIAAYADPEALRRLWTDNVATLRRHAPAVLDGADVDRLEQLALAYLKGREPLLRRRQQNGRIRDGHGDLLADDIFVLDDGPRVLDCLEFDPRLRCGDVLNDVAFLAMDLEHLGAPEAARDFLDAYAQFTGEQHPHSLEHHYVAYRAGVRSKVNCLRWAQGDESAAEPARELCALALRHLRRGQVPLTLVGGLPGTGKSTLAAGLSETLDGAPWTLLRSDVIRKELAGIEVSEPAAAPFDAGLYEPRLRQDVYAELLRRAETELGLGRPVIIDATFNDDDSRAAARRLATEVASPLIELECAAPDGITLRRISERRALRRDPSDADDVIYRQMAWQRTEWPAAHRIDTSGSPEAALAAARSAVEAALSRPR